MTYDRFGQIALNDDGAAHAAVLDDRVDDPTRVVYIYQARVPDTADDWQMVTRVGPVGNPTRPVEQVSGGCHQIAASQGRWMRRLYGLDGSQVWFPTNGYPGAMHGEWALTLDAEGTGVRAYFNGVLSHQFERVRPMGGISLYDGLASWVAFDGGGLRRLHVHDLTLKRELIASTLPLSAASPFAFRDGATIWIGYSTDELGGVCHPLLDASRGYRFGEPKRIWDVSLYRPSTGGIVIGWDRSEDKRAFGEYEIPTIGVGMETLVVPTPERAFGPIGESLPVGAPVDLRPFLVGTQATFPRKGTHALHQTLDGGRIHLTKWAAPNYETWAMDGDYLHHLEDASNDTYTYRFSDTRWVALRAPVGVVFDTGPIEAIYRDKPTGVVFSTAPWRNRSWTHRVWERFWCGPDLGERRVAMVVIDNTAGIHTRDRGVEVYLFAEGAGWIRWEYHRSDLVFADPMQPQFTDASRVARSDFYRLAPPPGITPQLTGYGASPPAPPPTIPPVPSPTPLNSPSVVVDRWTLNEMAPGREFVFHDGANANGVAIRVYISDDLSMHATMTNVAGTASTGKYRPVHPCPKGPTE